MRPHQWIKNGFVLMPLIFSVRLFVLEDVERVADMFLAFCLASSATYVLNDYLDVEQDKVHPTKKHRPLASGEISRPQALVLFGILVAATLALVLPMKDPILPLAVLAAYIVVHTLYSFRLKDLVIVDVLTISVGFLLRVLGGAVVIHVAVSSWLVLCTFSVAILLALGKRRHEVIILDREAANHRPVLENYSVVFLDQLLQVVTTSTFIFYCLYSVQGNPATGIHGYKMMFTIPLVTYGIFRYLYLIYFKEDGGSPAAMLLTDPPLLICTTIWLIACVAILYL